MFRGTLLVVGFSLLRVFDPNKLNPESVATQSRFMYVKIYNSNPCGFKCKDGMSC